MALDAVLKGPHLLLEEYVSRERTWYEYVIAAPGNRLTVPDSPPVMAVAGVCTGLITALLAMGLGFQTDTTIPGWAPLLGALVFGGLAGYVYGLLLNRYTGNGGLLRHGQAVRLIGEQHNEMVIEAAKRQAPGYFRAAQFAADLDKVHRRLEAGASSSAETAVLRQELQQGREQIRLMLTYDALVVAATSVGASDAAIGAAGSVTATIYEELQRGKAASYDENL